MHVRLLEPFESWPDAFPDRPNRRLVNPPQAVVVDVGRIMPIPADTVRSVPLRVSRGGVRLTGDAHGELLAWARVYDGHWIALVRVVVKAGQGQLPMIQWVPAATVRPTEPPTRT